jgi:hypothetical protein
VTVEDLLARLIAALNAADVPYMLTGSYASSLHSIPRATRDIDIIIFPSRDQLTRFIGSLPPSEYHTDLDDAIDALRRRGQFNVIDYATGWKIDFIIPPFDEFNVEEFERRQNVDLGSIQVVVASPEDVIVAKLLWAKTGESERQIHDAATVLKFQGTALNLPYIEKWVRRLQLDHQWTLTRTRAAV